MESSTSQTALTVTERCLKGKTEKWFVLFLPSKTKKRMDVERHWRGPSIRINDQGLRRELT